MPTRRASAEWEGGLPGGKGSFQGESNTISGSYSVGSRFAEDRGTNPEELLAAAEAACYSMALAAGLERSGATPRRVHTDAACTVEKVGDGFTITSMRLRVRAKVDDIDRESFASIAEETKKGCPVSRALAGVHIEVEAELE